MTRMLNLTDVARRYGIQKFVVIERVEAGFLPEPVSDGEEMLWSESELDAHDRVVWAGKGKPNVGKHFGNRHHKPERKKRSAAVLLDRLRRSLDQGDALPEDVTQWLREGLDAFSEGSSLDEALELNQSTRRARRDAALRAAGEHLEIASIHGKAKRLRLWAQWIEANKERGPIDPWMKLDAHNTPSEVERLVRAAVDSGLAMPASVKQYERILAVRHEDGEMSTAAMMEESHRSTHPR
jgi:hypothetical protein